MSSWAPWILSAIWAVWWRVQICWTVTISFLDMVVSSYSRRKEILHVHVALGWYVVVTWIGQRVHVPWFLGSCTPVRASTSELFPALCFPAKAILGIVMSPSMPQLRSWFIKLIAREAAVPSPWSSAIFYVSWFRFMSNIETFALTHEKSLVEGLPCRPSTCS